MKSTCNPVRRRCILAFVVVMTFVAVLSGCSNDDDKNTPSKTVGELITENNDFSLLNMAATKAGLLDLLRSSPALTLFAPNNAAFLASGISETTIANLTIDQLKGILQYHALAKSMSSTTIPSETNKAIPTSFSIGNKPAVVYMTKNVSGVFVNGAKVTMADQMASNGVIHTIDRLLFPPTGDGTLVGVVGGNPNLSLLLAAANKVGQTNPALLAQLAGSNTFTIFAPTNAAFTAVGYDQAKIAAASAEVLSAMLANHIVSGLIFSTDLKGGDVNALNQRPLTITVSGTGATVKSTNMPVAATITAGNYAASNGVVHVVDKVLVP